MYGDFGLLLVAYARNEKTIRLLETAVLAEIENIIVWIDGAQNENVELSQKLLIEDIKQIRSRSSKSKIQIMKTRRNFGAGASILSATSILFENFKYGVILEDDLVIDVEFFTFMQKALHAIEFDSDVWMVTGTRLRSENLQGQCEVMNYPVAWGWGTTAGKWREIYSSMQAGPIFSVKARRRIKPFWKVGYERAMTGSIDAWDVPLAAVMRSNQKLCLIPSINIVTNEGFDRHAIHTKRKIWPLGLPRGKAQNWNNFTFDIESKNLNNTFYEDHVYQIKIRHLFITLYGPILQYLRKGDITRRGPLLQRVVQARASFERL